MKNINEFDAGYLNFTFEEMKNNSLPFLDTEIYLDEKNIPQFRQYRKKLKSEVIINFKNSVTPRKYKISTLTGDIFRANYCSSTKENLEDALQKLTKIYLKNGYPLKLIQSEILKVKNRNFTSRVSKEEYEQKINEQPDKFGFLSLPFTSLQCESVGYEIINIIKNVTPEFSINLSWKNEKLSRFYSYRLKHSIPNLNKIGTIYKFCCASCQSVYIGETKRQLINRMSQHADPKHNSAISKHINEYCKKYQQSYREKYGYDLTAEHPEAAKNRLEFIKGCFSVIHSNLSNLNLRKNCEAIYIKLENPFLNRQIFSRKIKIF